jgi:hypothetical protein
MNTIKCTQKSALIGWKLIAGMTGLLVIAATPAWPQEISSAPSVDESALSPSEPAMSANQLAKEISNPVTSLWQLQFQFTNVKLENESFSPVSGKWVNNLYFQPVMPVSLTEELNLITRPAISLYDSVPHPTRTGGIGRTTTLGDTILALVLSPAHTEPWIWGAGATRHP